MHALQYLLRMSVHEYKKNSSNIMGNLKVSYCMVCAFVRVYGRYSINLTL